GPSTPFIYTLSLHDALPIFLSATPSGSDVLISWPLFAQDFQLEQNAQMSPGAWTAAPYSYTTGAAAVSVSTVVMGSNNFFRLKRSEEHTSELQSQSNLVCRL